MPGILRQGYTPNWGIEIDNLSSKWAASVTLAESFGCNSAYREHEQTNYLGQPCGYLAYYQNLTFDLSATVIHDDESDPVFASVSPYILGNQTASELALSTLAKNLGSGNSTAGLTQDIQWLAAEDVGNLDQLSQAARTLMVAFDGNQAAVKHWLPIMDDVAAGTSLTADRFTSMTARVQASGKAETEVLNMLRERGVPVYQMLAEEMGITAEQALKLTQNGQVGMKEWMAVVEKMHESYKGLSAELSSKTLEGAQATYEAAKSLAYKGAADAADAQEMARLNAKSAQFKIDAFDQELQTELTNRGLQADVSNAETRTYEVRESALPAFISQQLELGSLENLRQVIISANCSYLRCRMSPSR